MVPISDRLKEPIPLTIRLRGSARLTATPMPPCSAATPISPSLAMRPPSEAKVNQFWGGTASGSRGCTPFLSQLTLQLTDRGLGRRLGSASAAHGPCRGVWQLGRNLGCKRHLTPNGTFVRDVRVACGWTSPGRLAGLDLLDRHSMGYPGI